MMKSNDFSEDRSNANEKYRDAMELLQKVKDFADPVNTFKQNVSVEEERIKELEFKLDDLRSNSEDSTEKLRVAKTLNFRNSDPSVSYKTSKIKEMKAGSEGNIELGNDLNREANDYLDEALSAIDDVGANAQNMEQELNNLNEKVNADQEGIGKNRELLLESYEHAAQLDAQAGALQSEVANAKSPAERILDAANAYSTIAGALQNATSSAEKALETADEAASMVSQLFFSIFEDSGRIE